MCTTVIEEHKSYKFELEQNLTMTPFSSLYKIFLPVHSVASLRLVHVLTSFSSEEESIAEK